MSSISYFSLNNMPLPSGSQPALAYKHTLHRKYRLHVRLLSIVGLIQTNTSSDVYRSASHYLATVSERVLNVLD